MPINWSKSPINDFDGKMSASRILAFLAYFVALAHIVQLTFSNPPGEIKWSEISKFLVAVALPYLGNSVSSAVLLFKKTKRDT